MTLGSVHTGYDAMRSCTASDPKINLVSISMTIIYLFRFLTTQQSGCI